MIIITISSLSELFLGKGAQKICSKFTGEHLYQSGIWEHWRTASVLSNMELISCWLINFMLMFHFFIPWKCRETFGFLAFSGFTTKWNFELNGLVATSLKVNLIRVTLRCWYLKRNYYYCCYYYYYYYYFISSYLES